MKEPPYYFYSMDKEDNTMGKEVKYFCDLCDAEMESDNAYILKVSGTSGSFEREIYVCESHYKQLTGK